MIEIYKQIRPGHLFQTNKTGSGPEYSFEYSNIYNTHPSDEMSKLRLNLLKKYITNFKSVCDFGYGNGAFLSYCQKNNHIAYGYDISEYPVPTGVNKVEDIDSIEVDGMTFFDSIEHIEDEVVNRGVPGARDAINFLRSLRDMLAGHSTTKVTATVKWDGAPAIFAGIDPRDGKFFVAKKGVFNKEPKVYKTPADIDADTSGDLADKLKTALSEFKKLGIKSGVYQGDLMFTQGDLKKETIDEFHRLNMLKMAMAGINGLGIETIELERRGISYTYDTMKLLIKKNPDTDYFFIIGADMVEYLPKWYKIDELVQMVQFVGVQRPRYKAGTSYPIIWVDVPLMDISSSMVRDFIKQGRTPNFLLPHEVLDYIEEKGLYL